MEVAYALVARPVSVNVNTEGQEYFDEKLNEIILKT